MKIPLKIPLDSLKSRKYILTKFEYIYKFGILLLKNVVKICIQRKSYISTNR